MKHVLIISFLMIHITFIQQPLQYYP